MVAKLDALGWIHTSVLQRYADEFRIQLSWMRLSPPDTPNPGWQYAQRLKQVKALISEGIHTGEIRIADTSTAMLARCLLGVSWIPEHILRRIGTRAALVHVRDTTLRGVAAT